MELRSLCDLAFTLVLWLSWACGRLARDIQDNVREKVSGKTDKQLTPKAS